MSTAETLEVRSEPPRVSAADTLLALRILLDQESFPVVTPKLLTTFGISNASKAIAALEYHGYCIVKSPIGSGRGSSVVYTLNRALSQPSKKGDISALQWLAKHSTKGVVVLEDQLDKIEDYYAAKSEDLIVAVEAFAKQINEIINPAQANAFADALSELEYPDVFVTDIAQHPKTLTSNLKKLLKQHHLV